MQPIFIWLTLKVYIKNGYLKDILDSSYTWNNCLVHLHYFFIQLSYYVTIIPARTLSLNALITMHSSS